LARRGHEVTHVFYGELNERAASSRSFEADVYVIGKAFDDLSGLMEISQAKGHGQIIVDVCDNNFAPPKDGFEVFYEAM
jgi:hypothetical protein